MLAGGRGRVVHIEEGELRSDVVIAISRIDEPAFVFRAAQDEERRDGGEKGDADGGWRGAQQYGPPSGWDASTLVQGSPSRA